MLLGDCIEKLVGCYYQFAARDNGYVMLHCGDVPNDIYANKDTDTVRFGSMTVPFGLMASEPVRPDYMLFRLGQATLTIWTDGLPMMQQRCVQRERADAAAVAALTGEAKEE